jgi:hypothetical protein
LYGESLLRYTGVVLTARGCSKGEKAMILGENAAALLGIDPAIGDALVLVDEPRAPRPWKAKL